MPLMIFLMTCYSHDYGIVSIPFNSAAVSFFPDTSFNIAGERSHLSAPEKAAIGFRQKVHQYVVRRSPCNRVKKFG